MKAYHVRIIIALLFSVTSEATAERKIVYMSDSTQCKYEIQKGMLDGEYRSYYKNGKLKCEGQFLQNNRFGFWTFYQSNGDIQCIRDYRNNNSFDEKGIDNKLISVNTNSSIDHPLINERDIKFRKRYFKNLFPKENRKLFETENLLLHLKQFAKNNAEKLYTDYRFVRQANPGILNDAQVDVIQIKEDVIMDEVSQNLQFRLIGIGFLSFSEETKTYTELGWIYYPDIKKYLSSIKLTNRDNTYFCKTLLDIFEYRNFASKIVRRDIPSHAAGDAAALEQDQKLEVIDIENENTFIVNKIFHE